MVERGYLLSLFVGVAVTLGFMLYAGEPDQPQWWFGALPFGLWAAVPFVIMALAYRPFRNSPRSQLALWIGVLLIVAASVALLYDTFVVDLDAQGGIVLVILPLLQVVAFLPFLALALLRRRDAT